MSRWGGKGADGRAFESKDFTALALSSAAHIYKPRGSLACYRPAPSAGLQGLLVHWASLSQPLTAWYPCLLIQGTEETLLVDLGVYTRNRSFRLYLSSKAGKDAVLDCTGGCTGGYLDMHARKRPQAALVGGSEAIWRPLADCCMTPLLPGGFEAWGRVQRQLRKQERG